MVMIIEEHLILTPEKALIVGESAIIADLHLGLENAMLEKGIAIPRLQIIEIINSVRQIIENYNVERLIIAGDLKHEFSRNLPYEWEDVELFLNSFKDIELEIVRGNHDNYLVTILTKYGIPLKEKIKIKGWTVVHGHKGCNESKIIMGHEHPAIKIKFRGGIYSYPCYLKVTKDSQTVIVLPAFSPIVSGVDILTTNKFLSPILKEIKDIELFAIGEGEVVHIPLHNSPLPFLKGEGFQS